jgi:hypothetical protein
MDVRLRVDALVDNHVHEDVLGRVVERLRVPAH